MNVRGFFPIPTTAPFRNEDMERPTSGYLWDLCREHGVSVRTMAKACAYPARSADIGMRDARYEPGTVLIDDLHKAEQTAPAASPKSCRSAKTTRAAPACSVHAIASVWPATTLGLAAMVEAASHSQFEMPAAIFIIEEISCANALTTWFHCTVGLVISPYCKRGFVDSTPFVLTTASMVRTTADSGCCR